MEDYAHAYKVAMIHHTYKIVQLDRGHNHSNHVYGTGRIAGSISIG